MSIAVIHRCLAILVLALLAYLAVEGFYLGSLRGELFRQEDSIVRLADLDVRLMGLRSQLAALADSPASDAMPAFVGGTPDQALIELQEIVQTAVLSVGTAPIAVQANHDAIGTGVSRLGVLLQVSFSEQALLQFLRQIESSSTPLTVQKIDVLAPAMGSVGGLGLDVTILIGALHSNAV